MGPGSQNVPLWANYSIPNGQFLVTPVYAVASSNLTTLLFVSTNYKITQGQHALDLELVIMNKERAKRCSISILIGNVVEA